MSLSKKAYFTYRTRTQTRTLIKTLYCLTHEKTGPHVFCDLQQKYGPASIGIYKLKTDPNESKFCQSFIFKHRMTPLAQISYLLDNYFL